MTKSEDKLVLVSHNKPFYLPVELVDKLHSLTRPYLDSSGREVLNPVPMEIPLGFRRPLSLQDQIKRILRQEVSLHAMSQGMETFDESDDFEVDDSGFDLEPSSKYELMEDEVPTIRRRPAKASPSSDASDSSVSESVVSNAASDDPPSGDASEKGS
jgi:hypothetical protein